MAVDGRNGRRREKREDRENPGSKHQIQPGDGTAEPVSRDQILRLDTGEPWRNKLREIVTSPVPRQENSDSYDKLFKEMLPQSLWGLVSDENENEEPPFVMLKKGWWECLDYLDIDKVQEKENREAAIEAAKIKDPDLVQKGEMEDDDEGERDDIFSDFVTEERQKMSEFIFSPEDFEDDDTGDNDDDIRDGPGPGMEELNLDSIAWGE